MVDSACRSRILIGLTGNIATGKSKVSHMLATLGAGVIDADKVAHEVMRPGGPAYDQVVNEFGPDVLRADGIVDRARLGAIVFRDPAALLRLEAAVHPAVIAEVDRRIHEAAEPVIVVEAIKLIESGMSRRYDSLWVVTAPRQVQIARLMASRGLAETEAALRVDAQPPQEEKAAVADFVLTNEGDLPALREKVESAWAQIQGCATIRPARRDAVHGLHDAGGVAQVLNRVIREGHFTALTGHWTPEAELAFLQSLTMDHVCHFGTYVLQEYRDQGIGCKLAAATLTFALEQGYEKSVVYVLADNQGGQEFYRSLGFEPRGVLTRQTKIEGAYHDEVFMELHFEA
jgi:dephospho-CoA kinase